MKMALKSKEETRLGAARLVAANFDCRCLDAHLLSRTILRGRTSDLPAAQLSSDLVSVSSLDEQGG